MLGGEGEGRADFEDVAARACGRNKNARLAHAIHDARGLNAISFSMALVNAGYVAEIDRRPRLTAKAIAYCRYWAIN